MSGETLALSFQDLGRLACYLEDTWGCTKALDGTLSWLTIHARDKAEAETAAAKAIAGYEDH